MTDAMKMSELLPCPFCGGDASVDTIYPDYPEKGYGVTCLCNGCHGNIYIPDTKYPTKQDAISAWNTRTPSIDDIVAVDERAKTVEKCLAAAIHAIKDVGDMTGWCGIDDCCDAVEKAIKGVDK